MKKEIGFYKGIIKKNGLKVTGQRVAVVEAFLESKGEHLKVEDIYNVIHKKSPQIGLATVYRAVTKLSEIGILHRIRLDDAISRYDLVHFDNKDGEIKLENIHNHLICSDCGEIISFDNDILEGFYEVIEKKLNCTIKDYELKVYGYCPKDEESEEKREKESRTRQ